MESSLLYGPLVLPEPSEGFPLVVAAGRVRTVTDADPDPLFVSGWGTTVERAVQSCRYEADETYFAQIVPDDRVRRSPSAALQGRVIEPSEILLMGEQQYGGIKNDRSFRKQPPIGRKRWDRTVPEDWILSDSALSTVVAWLPARLCFLRHTLYENSPLPAADSNGLALGASVEQAATRAILELLERDATSIWSAIL